MARSATVLAALTFALLTGCASGSGADSAEQPATGFATADDGTRIAWRDWGGDGPTVVLLAGLGNTAAAFDDLAARLVDGHRVVGVTRRGFGDSDHPADGYDYATRTADDLAVLDELGIDRAVFIGHSIAGDELVALASDHESRTAGAVFLDAAAPSRGGPDSLKDCDQQARTWAPRPDTRGDASVQSHLDVLASEFGFPPPASFASEVAASWVFEDGSSRYTGSPVAFRSIVAHAEANPQDYGSVQVPALSLVALQDSATTYPWMTDDQVPAAAREAARVCAEQVAAFARAGAAEVADQNPAIEIQQWEGTHHYLHLQQPERTEAAIEAWLSARGL